MDRGLTERIAVAELGFQVKRSTRRRTVEIIVDRDGSLLLLAPATTAVEVLEGVVRTKAGWIREKLVQKEMLLRAWQPKSYVQGEGHSYLGRHYRLAIVHAEDEGQPPLRLRGAWFELRDDARADAADLFRQWYIDRGTEWLPKRIERYRPRLGVPAGPVDVRELGYRWASCGIRALNFHWRTMALPPSLVDYVIVHELAHVAEPSHGRAFWARVGAAMPDYARRRASLAELGAAF